MDCLTDSGVVLLQETADRRIRTGTTRRQCTLPDHHNRRLCEPFHGSFGSLLSPFHSADADSWFARMQLLKTGNLTDFSQFP